MTSATVAVLFTDLVGSTELLSRLGDDAFDEVRRDVMGTVARAVTDADGTEVKTLGDGTMAVFHSATDALTAAAAMQVAIGQAGRRRGVTLGLRVGISIGDASEEDGDWFGTPVVEAARLCAKADGGDVLLSDLVRLLAGTRGTHETTEVGPLPLKGLPEPVLCHRLVWAPADGAVRLPPELCHDEPFPFAGRAGDRDRLEGWWKDARQGRRQVALLSGEPGLGKTRLASEVARGAAEDGALVLFGRSDEDLDVPYQPFARALAQLVERAEADTLAAHAAACGDVLGRLVPALADPRGPDPGDAGDPDRSLLFDAVVDLLARVGADDPVVLVLDDLHWADRSSLQLLGHLVRAATPLPLLVLGTYRQTDLARTHPFAATLADLRRAPDVHRVALAGLTGDEVATFLAAGADADLGEAGRALAERLGAETAGNPFFLGEVVRHLVESGALVLQDGRLTRAPGADEALEVPEGVREVVGRRLSALPDGVDTVLQVAAVVGQGFDLGLVADVANLEVDDLLDDFDVLVQRGLVVEVSGAVDRYRFAHALVRQTLLDELSTSRRIRLHRQVGLALEARKGPAAELAHHFLEAAALGDVDRAVHWALEAADDAMEGYAFEQAASLTRAALDALGPAPSQDPATQAEIRLLHAEARSLSGEVAPARADFLAAAALARAANRPDLLAQAALGYGGPAGPWLEPGEATGPALVAEALAANADQDPLARIRLLIRQSDWETLATDDTERQRISLEALALARELGDPVTLGAAIAERHQALRGLGRGEEQLALSDELRQLAAVTGDTAMEAMSAYAAVGSLLALGRVRDAHAVIEALEPRGSAWAHWMRHSIQAGLAVAAGRLDDADSGLRIIRTGNPTGATSALIGDLLESEVAARRGRFEEALAVRRRQDRDHPLLALPLGSPVVEACCRGDVGGGRAALRTWFGEVLPSVPAPLRTTMIWFMAVATSSLGSTPETQAMEAELRPRSGAWVSGAPEFVIGPVDQALAALALGAGRLDDAERFARAALRALETEEAWALALDVAALLVPILDRAGRPGARDEAQATVGALAARTGSVPNRLILGTPFD